MKPALERRGVRPASQLIGSRVRNAAGDDLGKIEEIMVDLEQGRIAYAVLSFGGFLGFGDKLFAIPWTALTLDLVDKVLILNIDRAVLERAPGFDKDNWPDMADIRYYTPPDSSQLAKIPVVRRPLPHGRGSVLAGGFAQNRDCQGAVFGCGHAALRGSRIYAFYGYRPCWEP